jgi:GH43 family beta-xylosidase
MKIFRLRAILLTLLAGACACGKGNSNNDQPVNPVVPPDTTFTNPLLSSGPDPWVIQKDTTYYYMNTLGNRLAITSTSKMSQLAKGTSTTIWTPPATGAYSKEIWAPELHTFGGKWFMYFAADDGTNDNHRIYVLENDAADPTSANWTFKGKIADPAADFWAIDASAFQYNNQLYLIWSGWQGTVNTEQDIYIAQLSDPTTMQGHRVLISSPTMAWEKMGSNPLPTVNEGPEALINPGGQLFLTYSASGCWTDNYCLGLLTLRPGGDPLNPADWSKSPNPVFSTQSSNGAYAPGHNGFFLSRDGRQNWLLYHANTAAGQGCGNARSPRMQPFTWNSDGTPNFGTPVKINSPIAKPSGE